jgi:AraC-like DNA-binding protein
MATQPDAIIDFRDLIMQESIKQLTQVLANPFFAEMLFDQLPDVVFFVKDSDGRYLMINQTLMQRCGRKRKSEILGKTAPEVFPPELGASYAAQDQYVISSGRTIENQLELHLYINQTSVWCLTYKVPLLDQDENIIGLAGISRDLSSPDKDHPIYRQLVELLAYIQQHYAEPLKPEELARLAGLSLTRLERSMRRVFNLTPKQMIIKIRIEAALELLQSEQGIAEIAYACGYADHSAFSRQFKAMVGLSPVTYRALRKQAQGKLGPTSFVM